MINQMEMTFKAIDSPVLPCIALYDYKTSIQTVKIKGNLGDKRYKHNSWMCRVLPDFGHFSLK